MKIKSVKFLRKTSFLGGPHTVIMYSSLLSASGIVNFKQLLDVVFQVNRFLYKKMSFL